MKKALVIPLLILFGLLSFTLYNSRLMSQNTTLWLSQLQQATDFLQAENWESVTSTLEQSYTDWSARQVYLHVVSTHDEIHAAEAMYQRALAFANSREPSELQAEIANLQAQMIFLEEMEQFTLHNIF